MLLAGGAHAGEAWSLGGELRVVGVWDERHTREGAREDFTALRARVRVFGEWRPTSALQLRARLAGRYGSDQDGASAFLHSAAPTRNGAALGDATMDELYLRLAPAEQDWALRVGRFQSVYALATLQGKSLERNDGPHTDVHWTDGVHGQLRLAQGLQLHAIAQYLPSGGPGSTHRTPLDFSRSGSRWGGYFALESRQMWGPVFQRGIGLTYFPDSLALDGLSAQRRSDYASLTTRATAAWPLGDAGTRLLLGGELARAARSVSGRSRNGWQAELDIEGPGRRHSSGVVLGSAGGSLLTASDFRDNERLFEWRYLWRVRADLSLDARWRWRREIEVPAAALQRRVDRDVYLRATWRF